MFLVMIYISRPGRNMAPRFLYMAVVYSLVRLAERLNQYASQHWQDWAITQNYFDEKGIFVSILLCAPLLVDSFIMLVLFLREASQLLVQVKRQQLAQKKKKKE